MLTRLLAEGAQQKDKLGKRRTSFCALHDSRRRRRHRRRCRRRCQRRAAANARAAATVPCPSPIAPRQEDDRGLRRTSRERGQRTGRAWLRGRGHGRPCGKRAPRWMRTACGGAAAVAPRRPMRRMRGAPSGCASRGGAGQWPMGARLRGVVGSNDSSRIISQKRRKGGG